MRDVLPRSYFQITQTDNKFLSTLNHHKRSQNLRVRAFFFMKRSFYPDGTNSSSSCFLAFPFIVLNYRIFWSWEKLVVSVCCSSQYIILFACLSSLGNVPISQFYSSNRVSYLKFSFTLFYFPSQFQWSGKWMIQQYYGIWYIYSFILEFVAFIVLVCCHVKLFSPTFCSP